MLVTKWFTLSTLSKRVKPRIDAQFIRSSGFRRGGTSAPPAGIPRRQVLVPHVSQQSPPFHASRPSMNRK